MDRATIVSWWEGLAPRERGILGVGLLVAVAVAIYVLLWEPPAAGIRKLQADLPQLRSQEAAMRAMADEAARLRSASGVVTSIAPSERVAAVRRSLERAGLWREGAEPRPAGAAAAASTISTLSLGGTVTTVASAASSRFEPPEVVADTEARVKVRFDDIDYGVWVAWLAATEGELAARATRVTIVALAPRAPVGHVRAEAVLDWATPATSSSSPRS